MRVTWMTAKHLKEGFAEFDDQMELSGRTWTNGDAERIWREGWQQEEWSGK